MPIISDRRNGITGRQVTRFDNPNRLTSHLVEKVHLGDHVLMMRNGGFGGIHARLLDTLHHSCHEDSVLTPMHRYGGMRKDLRFAVIVYAAK